MAASSSLGSLVVSLGLDAADYFSGMLKVDGQATKAMSAVGSSVDGVTSLFKTLAGVVSATALALQAVHFVTAAAEIDDLAERTGSTVENMAQLERQAYISGISIESVEGAIIKLTKALNDNDEGSKKVQKAVSAIGLSVDDLRQMDPADAFRTIAVSLNQFADGGGKTAVMLDLMGKGAAAVAPFLKDLANDEQVVTKLTTEQAAAAEQAGKQLRYLLNESRELKQQLVLDLVPAFTEFVKWIRTSIQDVGTLETALIGAGNAIAFITRQTDVQKVGRQVEALDDQIETMFKQLESGSLKPQGVGGIFSFLIPNVKLTQDAKDKISANIDELIKKRDALLAPTSAGAPPVPTNLTPPKDKDQLIYKALPDEAKLKAAALALQKLIEQQSKISLAIVTDQAKREEQLLDIQHQNNLVSEQDYWDQKAAIQKRAYDASYTTLSVQADSEKKFLSAQAKGTAEYYNATGKLEQTLAERNKLEKDFEHAGKLALEQQAQATRNYAKEVESLNIQLLELQGNSVEAARRRFDAQNKDVLARATANKDQGTIDTITALGRGTVVQAQFNDAREQADLVAARLSITEDRLQNSLRTGAISEIDALIRTGTARKEAADAMEKFVLQREKLAAENPGMTKLVIEAEQARAALERLRAESDLLAEKFDTIFKDAGATALTDFLDKTKSANEAFKSFSDNVVRGINRMAAEAAISELGSLFGITGGQKGGGGGIKSAGGFLASIFSGGFGLGGGGGGSSFMNFGSGGVPFEWSGAGFASGIERVPHDMIAKIHKGEQIVPANQNRYGDVNLGGITIVTPDVAGFRAAKSQVAADMAGAAQTAVRRFR